MSNVYRTPFVALLLQRKRGLREQRDGDGADGETGKSGDKRGRSLRMIGTSVANGTQSDQADAEQQLRSALRRNLESEQTRQHVRGEALEAGEDGERRQQPQRRVQQQPSVERQQRQPSNCDRQPIAQHGCQKEHQRSPENERRWRIHEQEREQRPRFHRPQPAVQAAAAQPAIGHDSRRLHQPDEHRADQPHRGHERHQPPDEEREIRDRTCIQRLDHPGCAVALAMVERQEDHASQERNEEAGGVAGHEKAAGHDVPRVVAHRVVLLRRVVVEGEGRPASGESEQREQPRSERTAKTAQFQQGDGAAAAKCVAQIHRTPPPALSSIPTYTPAPNPTPIHAPAGSAGAARDRQCSSAVCSE